MKQSVSSGGAGLSRFSSRFSGVTRTAVSILEGVRIAFAALRANKTRSALTTTCIVIGIVSVTAMNTITDGVDRAFDQSMEMLGRNVVYVEKWPWGIGGGEYRWWEYRNRREMDIAYREMLERLVPSASMVTATAARNAPVRYMDRTVPSVGLSGVTPGHLRTSGLQIEQGRDFTEEENQRGARVVILGASLVNVLFPGEDPIGKQVRIRGGRYSVIGTLEARGRFLGMMDFDNTLLMPIRSFGNLFGLRNGITMAVQFPSEEAMVEGEYELEGAMRQIRQLDPLQENDFALNRAAQFETQFATMKLVIYGIGIFLTGLALFVGGIGVMNIMYVSVRERTREIGLRKAVGAQSWEILLQFMMEALVICLAGGVVGILLSLGVTWLINRFFVAWMDWTTVLQALLICGATGLLFGWLPASRAAKSEPVESLRYE